MKPDSLEAWLAALGEGGAVALFSHVSPDGDTVGAALALRLALLASGKDVRLFCADPVPEQLRFLPGAEDFLRPDGADGFACDTAVAVDVSAPEMLGASLGLYMAAPQRLVIDHHGTNPGFGRINFIRGGESSCCLLACEAIRAMGVPVTREIATCLMLGMSTDTGHFRYASTTPETLEAAAFLMRCGADVAEVTRRMYRMQPRRRVELMRRALNSLRFASGGRIGRIALTAEDYRESGCDYADADGLVNLALEIEGVRMAFLLSERGEETKASLRAMEPDTVDDVARLLGGGGHAQAAGCTLKMRPAEAERAVLEAMERKLEGA